MANVRAKKGKRVVSIPAPFNVDVTDDGSVNVDTSHPVVAALIASGDLVVLDATAAPTRGAPSSTPVAYDLLANRPAAASVRDGYVFVAVDDNGGTLYQTQSNIWVKIAAGVLETGGRELNSVEVQAAIAVTGALVDVPAASIAFNAGARPFELIAMAQGQVAISTGASGEDTACGLVIVDGATIVALGVMKVKRPAAGNVQGLIRAERKITGIPAGTAKTYKLQVMSLIAPHVGWTLQGGAGNAMAVGAWAPPPIILKAREL